MSFSLIGNNFSSDLTHRVVVVGGGRKAGRNCRAVSSVKVPTCLGKNVYLLNAVFMHLICFNLWT